MIQTAGLFTGHSYFGHSCRSLVRCCTLKARVTAPRFYLGLLPAKLCLVTLFSSEQYSQFERFHPKHVEIVSKTSRFKTKLIGNNAEMGWVKINPIHLDVDLSQGSRHPVTNYCSNKSGQRSRHRKSTLL